MKDKDEDKTREQIINELVEMRQRITELEASETQRKQVEEALWKWMDDLGERVREVCCLCAISDLVEKRDISLEEILQGIVDFIPRAWQYPEITCAQVILEGQIFRTNNFKETIWKQACDIIVHSDGIGTLEVCYLDEKPERDEGPFLKKERSLINAIAERLGEIIERKRMEEALKESQEKYRRIWETSKDVLYLTSRKGKFIDINQAGADLFGYSKKELLKIDLARHLYVNPYDRKRFQEMIEKDGFVKNYEVQFKKKDKTKIYVSITANVRRDRNGNALGYEGIIRDITEKKKAEEEIKRLYEKMKDMAQKDPLTGLFNHGRINELLEHEIERSKRGLYVFSIMMLDVDDLKLINDTYGHIIGDRLLKNVASLLKSTSRLVDLIGRYAGDEFLIILPYTDGEKAKSLAERISQRMKQKGLKLDEKTNIPIRLSIGTATYPYDSMISRELVALADRGMYESKRSGRSVVSASYQK